MAGRSYWETYRDNKHKTPVSNKQCCAYYGLFVKTVLTMKTTDHSHRVVRCVKYRTPVSGEATTDPKQPPFRSHCHPPTQSPDKRAKSNRLLRQKAQHTSTKMSRPTVLGTYFRTPNSVNTKHTNAIFGPKMIRIHQALP